MAFPINWAYQTSLELAIGGSLLEITGRCSSPNTKWDALSLIGQATQNIANLDSLISLTVRKFLKATEASNVGFILLDCALISIALVPISVHVGNGIIESMNRNGYFIVMVKEGALEGANDIINLINKGFKVVNIAFCLFRALTEKDNRSLNVMGIVLPGLVLWKIMEKKEDVNNL